MNPYDYVQFADDTKGLILSIKHEGEHTTFNVLTDGYEEITCDSDQVGEINRHDVPMLTLESHHSGGKVYRLFTSEINMLTRYRMAVWHDYWAKQESNEYLKAKATLPMGAAKHQAYWDIYRAGNVEPLPVEKDIRRSEAIRPTQESMDIGATNESNTRSLS